MMNEHAKSKITEVNFIPVKPKDGLIGFVSFVYNRQFYFGNISVFTHLSSEKKSTYRLSYPEDRIRRKSFFHPINRLTQLAIEKAVSDHIDTIKSKAVRPYSLMAACFCLASVLLFRTPASADISSGKTMTKKFEGWRSTVYVDPVGMHQSIGYGFNIDTPRVKKILSPAVLSGRIALEKQEADHVFDVLYREAQKSTIQFIGQHNFQRLSDVQKDILIDMAYNLGSRRLSKFKKMRAAIAAGDYRKAAAEMKDSKWYRQTGRRGRHHVREFKRKD